MSDYASVVRVVSTVPSATATKKISFPAGAYRVALLINPSVTGTTTSVAIAPFLDAAQTAAGPAYYLVGPGAAAAANALVLNPGTTPLIGRALLTQAGTTVTAEDPIITITNGLQVTITKGTAVTDEKLEVDLVLALVRTASVVATVV